MHQTQSKSNPSRGTKITRRSILAAAPALAACTPVAAMGMTPTPSDVPRLVAEVQGMRSDLGPDGIKGSHEYYVVREKRMAAIFDALDGVCAKSRTPHDPIPGWFAEWKKWRKVEVELSALPEGGDFDLPEQIAASNRCEKLSEQIAHAKPTTAAGVAAQLEWLDVDSFGLGGIGDLNIFALRNAIAAMQGGVVVGQ